MINQLPSFLTVLLIVLSLPVLAFGYCFLFESEWYKCLQECRSKRKRKELLEFLTNENCTSNSIREYLEGQLNRRLTEEFANWRAKDFLKFDQRIRALEQDEPSLTFSGSSSSEIYPASASTTWFQVTEPKKKRQRKK